ncbi:putative 3-phosphoinositide-dependent protein kinase 2 [Schistocerca gregaria]|uniref:putative 3-phosphoinositide-dependent protein kinase 2 n=1 Tax=Schistocerca gregaria TaxID=7010 RepID=UPI00211E7948|nr:putative 3-phosphoinositide-dependent protein kinase 2 [Schistocerca gregaria]
MSDQTLRTTVNDFIFKEVLGEGAYGAVFLATEKKTQRNMAIKVIHKKNLNTEQKMLCAKNEKNIMSMCNHPYIVKLYMTFQDENCLYYCTELAPNGELYTWVDKFKGLSIDCVVFYAAQLVLALEYLHGKGIAHRDLKLENILLDENFRIKLTDFGTAELVGRDVLAYSSSFVGTPSYMAPEFLQTENRKVYKSADLWALGCILYQMICCRLLFYGCTEYLTFKKIQAGKIVYPINMPKDAEDLISKLLVVDSLERLGAKSFEDLKSHPFFKIDWKNIDQIVPNLRGPEKEMIWREDLAEETEEPIPTNVVEKKPWEKHLLKAEKTFFSGLVYKRRKFSIKKRMLILTDMPRLIYVDPKNNTLKGEISWSDLRQVEKKTDVSWKIYTPKRTYHLEDISKDSQRWLNAIETLRNEKNQNATKSLHRSDSGAR